MSGRSRVESAFSEEPARRVGFGRRQLATEEFRRRRVRGEQSRATGVLGCGSPVFVVQSEGDPPCEPLDRLGERDVVHLRQERVDIARLATAEAVVEARLRSHVEAGTAFVMEGTQALHGTHARVLEGDPLADDVGDVRTGLHLLDVGLSDPPGHQRPSGRRAPGDQMPTDAASSSPTRV